MAIPNNDQSDFEAAFGEDTPAANEPSEDDAFGITPPAPSATDDHGAAAAADVIEVIAPTDGASAPAEGGVDDGTASKGEEGEEAANATAAAQAREVTEANNEKAVPDAGSTSTAVMEAGSESNGEGTPVEEASESPAVEAAEVAQGMDGGEAPAAAKPPMTEQQLRSWEGRIRAAEAALAAKAAPGEAPAAASGDALEQVSEQAEDSGNTALADKAEELGEQVESGEITAAEAMTSLTADFGEGFVKMIEAVAREMASKVAGEQIAGVGKNVEDVISHIKDSTERAHFETIADAFPDFVAISKTPEFEAFVKAQGAEQVVESGSAKQIVALLTAFEAGKPKAPEAAPVAAAAPEATPVDDVASADALDAGAGDDAADAAEGVRSGGLRLPETPSAGSDDYEKAWNEA